MRVYLFYRSRSENERQVRDFIHDLEVRGETGLKLMDLNTREGSSMASLYDIMQTPTVLVTAEDGSMINISQGTLPLVNEITFFMHQ